MPENHATVLLQAGIGHNRKRANSTIEKNEN